MMKINTTALEKLPDGVDANAMVVTMVHYGPDVRNRVYIIVRERSPSPYYPDYYHTVTRYGKLDDYRKYGLNALRGHGRGGSVSQFYRIVREKLRLGYDVVWAHNANESGYAWSSNEHAQIHGARAVAHTGTIHIIDQLSDGTRIPYCTSPARSKHWKLRITSEAPTCRSCKIIARRKLNKTI